ncbi:hypothetical protein BHE74_00023577, partial [Ensete ventricosum]
VVYLTLQVELHEEEASDKQLPKNFNLLEEKRAKAHLRDLVLQKAEVSDPTRAQGKLALNWECPYQVIDVIREGTWTLTMMDGK